MPTNEIRNRQRLKNITAATKIGTSLLRRLQRSGFDCVYCKKKIDIFSVGPSICSCSSMFYCSSVCEDAHEGTHAIACKNIQELVSSVRDKTRTVLRFSSYDQLVLFKGHGFEYRNPHPEYYHRQYTEWRQLPDARSAMFGAIQALVKALLQLGASVCELSGHNVLSYEIATNHCLDLLLLRRDANMILNVYLVTGNIEKLYDLCCYYTRQPHSSYSGLSDDELNTVWEKKVPKKDITKPFKHHRLGVGEIYGNVDSIQWMTMCHIYLIKYLLYMNMENLMVVNKQYLDNQDCIDLIGEFIGMKKGWVINGHNNGYKDQAIDVIRLFRCAECYYRIDHFELLMENSIKKFVDDLGYPTHIIEVAIKDGKQWMSDIDTLQKAGSESNPNWDQMTKSYQADHSILYSAEIEPFLPDAIKRINTLAGWSVMSTVNTNPSMCLTKFITEASKLSQDQENFHLNFFEFMDWGPQVEDEYILQDEELTNNPSFSTAVATCLAIEKKLAQIHFHKHKHSHNIQEILNRLPGKQQAYICDMRQNDTQEEFWDMHETSFWPEDVTKIVEALFKEDMATNENLDALFEISGYLSQHVLELQRHRNFIMHRRIKSFIIRTRLWKEGCIDNDQTSGLKILYLNKSDRKQKFEEFKRLASLKDAIQFLQPSLGQFISKFGWDSVQLKPAEYAECIAPSLLDEDSAPMSKRPRCDLDSFHNLSDACRHFFDTASLEEAVWDFVGVPRIVVLNGTREKMQKAGWKYCHCQVKSVLGDKAVKIGSRVAHVNSSNWCIVWKETSNTDMT